MLTLLFVAGSLLTAPQDQKAASPTPACTILTAQEVASIIGPAKPMTVTNSPGGSTCMFQNGDKLITVLIVNLSTVEAAKGQWDAQKRVSAGQDVAGWPLPTFSSVIDQPKQHVAVVGFVKDKRFLEAKAIDLSQKASDLSTKLLAVMKPLSGRF